jgi:hypothetical protein
MKLLQKGTRAQNRRQPCPYSPHRTTPAQGREIPLGIFQEEGSFSSNSSVAQVAARISAASEKITR